MRCLAPRARCTPRCGRLRARARRPGRDRACPGGARTTDTGGGRRCRARGAARARRRRAGDGLLLGKLVLPRRHGPVADGEVTVSIAPAERAVGPPVAVPAQFPLPLAVVGQADSQPRAFLVQRASDPAALGRDRAKLLLIELTELSFRLIPCLEQPASVVRADRVDQPLPRLPRIRQLGHLSPVLARAY